MKNFNSSRVFLAVAIVAMSSIVLAGCGAKPTETEQTSVPTPPSVQVASVSDLRSMTRTLTYSGIVAANQETTYAAKAAGTLRGLSVKVGDRVTIAQELAVVNDADNAAIPSNTLKADQVRQAQLAVSQALQGYQIAQTSYQTVVQTSAKDLSQAEIARRQAESGQTNTGASLGEQLTAAKLGRDTAATAAEQARLALENRKTQVTQSETDAKANASLTANNAVDTCRTFVTQMDSLAAFGSPDGGNLSYAKYLGATDGSSYTRARSAWETVKASTDAYAKMTETDPQKRLEAARKVVDATKMMVDATKNVFDHTPPSVALPQSSAAGASISGFQQQLASAQTQANALLTQIQATQQGLESLVLSNRSSLDALEKARDLATQQLASAEQNIKTLEAGTKTQQDQLGYGVEAARNQESTTRARVDGQLAASRGQMELAKLQYDNAVVALESLIDSRKVVASMNGVVTKVFVENGASITPGTPVLTVSTVDAIKVIAYVDQANIAGIRPGMDVTIAPAEGAAASGTVLTVSPVADAMTKRFAVEIRPSGSLLLGTVVSVQMPVTREAPSPSIILPIDAMDVRSDASAMFVVRDGSAVRLPAQIGSMFGESTIVTATDLREDDQVIIRGAKLILDGGPVSIAETTK
ncbi:MAG: HlyD family efflux transporter periplasmic adaptor subunit [Candidatus Uhrbacteria bacterium]|nr:HlyD family efflux transporter periplasmic adaptor subunit [Candidatus Uhrbacteria bacterium]